MTNKVEITNKMQEFNTAINGKDIKRTYIEIARMVCIEAMEKLDSAVEKGNFAESQGTYANAQGTYAKTQGDMANVQGTYANEQGTYAKAQGDRVNNVIASSATQTEACKTATQSSASQTTKAKDATKQAIEAATGFSLIYDPSDGQRKTTQDTLYHMWSELVNMFGSPLTVTEFDALLLTAEAFNSRKITAYEFDTRGKAILTGGL